MSSWNQFWDRYLAPGDVRTARAALLADAKPTESPSDIPVRTIERSPRLDAATRARRQNGLLFGGLIFSVLSVLITRRAVARKIRLAPTTTTSPAGDSGPSISGGLDAVEALSLATLNCFSFGLFGLGVVAKWLDVADIEGLRDLVRRGQGYDVYGGDRNAEADKELAAWITEALSSKEADSAGLRESIMGRLAMAELEKLTKDQPVIKSKE